jgi:rubrerythrin
MPKMPDSVSHQRWRLEDIDLDAVDAASVRDDEFLFLTLASASFVEILAETYNDNLLEHFRGNTEVTDWLDGVWQKEEVQHGRALRAYVQRVWPEFDWERAYGAFRTEYGALCTVEQLEPQQALELVARCVVETGTSTFYRALHDYVSEPVLRQLIEHIKTDEVAHYTHFRRYFEACNRIERHGVGAVIGTIWRRVREVRGEDAYIAFRHVHAARHPEQPFLASDLRRYNRVVKRLARRHYPYLMLARMLIKPVPMAEPFKRILQWPLVGLALLASLG